MRRINFVEEQDSIFNEIGWPLPSLVVFAAMAPTDHREAMSLLLESPKFSDLVLACQDQEFLVHRAIVCPHSPFFSKSCSGDFKVGYLPLFGILPSTAAAKRSLGGILEQDRAERRRPRHYHANGLVYVHFRLQG